MSSRSRVDALRASKSALSHVLVVVCYSMTSLAVMWALTHLLHRRFAKCFLVTTYVAARDLWHYRIAWATRSARVITDGLRAQGRRQRPGLPWRRHLGSRCGR